MTINEYQDLALRTEKPLEKLSIDCEPLSMRDMDRLVNGLMGLCGESGEAMDILKKCMYQGHPLDREALAKELGDVAWYLALASSALGYSLERICEKNIEKLRERYPNGFEVERSVNRAEEKDNSVVKTCPWCNSTHLDWFIYDKQLESVVGSPTNNKIINYCFHCGRTINERNY